MFSKLTVLFSLTFIYLSSAGMLHPHGPLSIIMSTDSSVAVGRILFALVLGTYALFPSFRYGIARGFLLVGAFILMSFLTTSMVNDMAAIPEPLDVFFVLQSTLLALIAVLDFARPKQVYKFVPNITIAELMFAKIKTILFPTLSPPSQHKTT